MDPITLIVTALAAGAISALQDQARDTLRSAYLRLRGLARKRVAGNAAAELALAEYEADPETWEARLAAKLTELGAKGDPDLVAAAKALMEIVDTAGARAGNYNVTISGSKGVQVGDGNFQVNRFNFPPSRENSGI
jgi:hypothetical protein